VTVLVVDDEPTDVEAIRNPLEKAGFLVFSADSTNSALQIFQHNARGFDMAVLDISMPEKNGVDLYQELLTLNPNLKVLFVSGHVGAEIIRFYGLRATDRHFLQKPFESSALIVRIREILESPAQLRLEDFQVGLRETRSANGH
jgi:DNA-binding response OmpR family regulator